MGAGQFREVITIQSPDNSARNKFGGVISGWTNFVTTRASFEPLIGREFFAAEQVNSQVEVKFRIRYREGIRSNFRVVHRGVPYEILYEPIDVGGNRRELLMYCKRVD